MTWNTTEITLELYDLKAAATTKLFAGQSISELREEYLPDQHSMDGAVVRSIRPGGHAALLVRGIRPDGAAEISLLPDMFSADLRFTDQQTGALKTFSVEAVDDTPERNAARFRLAR